MINSVKPKKKQKKAQATSGQPQKSVQSRISVQSAVIRKQSSQSRTRANQQLKRETSPYLRQHEQPRFTDVFEQNKLMNIVNQGQVIQRGGTFNHSNSIQNPQNQVSVLRVPPGQQQNFLYSQQTFQHRMTKSPEEMVKQKKPVDDGISDLNQRSNIHVSPAQLSNNNPHAESSSTSFYQDLSRVTSSSFSQTNFGTNAQVDITHQQICLTKAIAAIFRFKARKAGSTFWRWKFSPFSVHQPQQQQQHVSSAHKKDADISKSIELQGSSMHDKESKITEAAAPNNVEGEHHLIQKYKLSGLISKNDSQSLQSAAGARTKEEQPNGDGEQLLTDENIDDEGVEATISQHKKSKFSQPVAFAGPDKKQYDFSSEEINQAKEIRIIESTRKPDDGTVPASQKPQIYYQILNSKNKDFGKILQTSESMASESDYEEIGGGTYSGAPGTNAQSLVEVNNQITDRVVKQTRAIISIQKILGTKLRRVVRFWRHETEIYLNEMEFKLRSQSMLLQKKKVTALIKLRVINERSLLANMAGAFSWWRLETQVDTKALDRRQQLFMMNNAKMDVQRSKAALQQLYRMQRYQNQGLGPPGQNNMAAITPWNPLESAATLVGTGQGYSPLIPQTQSQQAPLGSLTLHAQNSANNSAQTQPNNPTVQQLLQQQRNSKQKELIKEQVKQAQYDIVNEIFKEVRQSEGRLTQQSQSQLGSQDPSQQSQRSTQKSMKLEQLSSGATSLQSSLKSSHPSAAAAQSLKSQKAH